MKDATRRAYSAAIGAQLKAYADEHGPLGAIHHTVQMTSFGGSGSTALSKYLMDAGVDLPKTPGEAPFKHQRVPPPAETVPAGFRVLYPFADPRDAMLSIFRRGFVVEHYRGLFMRQPTPEVERQLADVEAFVAGGVDHFRLADHVERWMAPGRGYPVLFFRYEALEEAWPAIRDFVGLPATMPCFALRPRKSRWAALPEHLRDGLDRIYEPLIRTLREIPVAEIR